jgi:predicted RNA-binding Zn ribbon-like protein
MVTDPSTLPPPEPTPLTPGSLALVIDFINTCVTDEGGKCRDELPTQESLAAWLSDRGLLAGKAPVSGADWQRAIAVREALRALLFGKCCGREETAAAALLTKTAAEARLSLAFTSQATAALAPAAEGVLGALGRLLAEVQCSMADGRWARLKACQNESCRYAFYDRSKNQSRAWCSMSPCGNRLKARARRQRLRAAGDGR